MILRTNTPPVPSPARLGLSSPPSNPNPKPSTPPPAPQPAPPPSSSSSSLSPSSSTSTSLLSLLPPLPRAQSLLLQISSLSSHLFHLSPNRSLWSSSYRGLLPSFLPNPNPNPSPAPSSTKDLLSLVHHLQTLLFESVAELQEILDLQDSTAKLVREIRSLDSALLSFTKQLKRSELVLDQLVDDYSDYLNRDLSRPNLDLNEVLAYAHKISYTTFAPPEHGAGLAPLRGALPPAPQDNEMRASQLYHFADLDVGVAAKRIGAGAEEGKESGEMKADKDILMEPTPPREEVMLPLPPMLPIAVPPGWKREMLADLPVDLPRPPPGWKPGDPVQLQPLDAAVREEALLRAAPPVVQKGPEAIQVKYVQLDINPDQDEYSSDYSSEAGSSDEEDDD